MQKRIASQFASSMEDDWPILDFGIFPDNMISGLTYDEIVAVCNEATTSTTMTTTQQQETNQTDSQDKPT